MGLFDGRVLGVLVGWVFWCVLAYYTFCLPLELTYCYYFDYLLVCGLVCGGLWFGLHRLDFVGLFVIFGCGLYAFVWV